MVGKREVRIDEKLYRTVLDDQGVQRFPVNRLARDYQEVSLQEISV